LSPAFGFEKGHVARMNIAIFASAFHPYVGGVEELCRQLAHAYIDDGHRPIVVTNQWPRTLPREELYEGIPIYRIPMRVPAGSLRMRTNYRLTSGLLRRRLLGLLKDHNVDLIHVQCVSTNGYYAQMAKRALGLPLVITAQGELTMDADQIYQTSGFLKDLLRELLDEADRITACSGSTLEDLERFYGRDFGDRASVVYNGISLAEFDRVPNPSTFKRPYILAIGRHVVQKGFDVLIRAFAQSGLADLDLVIAGDGPERQTLNNLIDELGLRGRVHLPGRADRPTVAGLFKGCEFFVLPSRQEPLGIVNLEAMAAGKPVIASRVGGVPEIVIENETGMLVSPEDPTALAHALCRLASDGELRTRMGRAGRTRADAFDWPAIAKRYVSIYGEIMRPLRSSGMTPMRMN
jgi:glycosyltransferase involved in cell wall biosynthesis